MRTTKLLDLLFPPRCVWCGRVKGAAECCEAGLVRLSLSGKPVSLTCGQSAFFDVYALYRYEDEVREAIHRFKFEDGDWMAAHLATILFDELWETAAGEKGIDCIMPVPMTKREKNRRGYSQTELLAQSLSKKAGVPVYPDGLVKVRETRRQSSLTRDERLTNVKNAFEPNLPLALAGKRVLVVDDVVTTGSTLLEATRALEKAGAKGAAALCIAASLLQG